MRLPRQLSQSLNSCSFSVTKIYPVSITVATIARNATAAILFGGDGVLINNIAWLLRRLPVFAVGGTGAYRIRPVHIDDLARLCLAAGRRVQHLPRRGRGRTCLGRGC